MRYGNGGGGMMGSGENMMETITQYFSNPWVIFITIVIIVLLIVWFMSGGKENYRHY
jgi:hypothetical protein